MNEKTELMKYVLLHHISKEQTFNAKYSRLTELAEQITVQFNKSSSEADALESAFNKMNGHDERSFYDYKIVDNKLFFPSENAKKAEFDCKKCLDELSEYTIGSKLSDIDHMLEIFKKYTAFLPASYFGEYGSEISYFDHIRMVCAVASCLYDHLNENNSEAVPSFDDIRDKAVFMLYSFDTSGIQNFIYTITSEGALKGLRARSFYLEMVMEVIVSELLERTGMSKANLIYAGGGHAYILLPNTGSVKGVIDGFMDELRTWLMDTFRASLFVADGSSECSADSLSNIPEGSYRNIFRTISEKISKKKMHRYTAADIIKLNTPLSQHERECRICHRSDRLNKDNKCRICSNLEKTASEMLRNDYFAVWKNADDINNMLVLPFGLYLSSETHDSLISCYKQGKEPYRLFSKNKICDSFTNAVSISVGDYASAANFGELIKSSNGIERLSVLRADADNLGQAFVSGYPEKIMTLSRTAAFSRLMSDFFKLYINDILKNGRFHLDDNRGSSPRNAVIVYSGGDDIFIAGSWDDIIGFGIDLHEAFSKFTQGTLSISAGIGMYHEKYPIAAMARNSGSLEDHSKQLDGKNAVTLFDYSNRYSWDEFINSVIGEKLKLIKKYMKENDEKGNSMLYQMMSLIRDISEGERLNIARFSYFLGRLRPDEEKSSEPAKQQAYKNKLLIYQEFADNFYHWIRNEKDRAQLITAIRLYVYLNRKKEEEKNGGLQSE